MMMMMMVMIMMMTMMMMMMVMAVACTGLLCTNCSDMTDDGRPGFIFGGGFVLR